MNTTVLGESLQLEDKASNVDDFEELKDFVFDHENNINVDALEAYLNANKDELMEQEDEINIDISTMMVKGALDKSIDSGIGSTASEVSSNAQSTQNQASSNNQAPSSTQQVAGALSGGSIEHAFYQELQNEEALQPFLESETLQFSTKAEDLNERDSEYVITAVKHFFKKIAIVQYEIHNTLEDQILSNVQIKISKFESKHNLKMKGMIPLHEDDQIKYNEKRFAYVVLDLDNASTKYPHLTISQKMLIKITEIDIDSQDELGSYDEEYTTISDLKLSTKDYIHSQIIPKDNFNETWEQLGAQGQRDDNLADKVQTFQLPFKSMDRAVNGVLKFFDTMSVCDGSNKVNVTEKVHKLFMSGLFFGTHHVLLRGQIGFNAEYGCVLKL